MPLTKKRHMASTTGDLPCAPMQYECENDGKGLHDPRHGISVMNMIHNMYCKTAGESGADTGTDGFKSAVMGWSEGDYVAFALVNSDAWRCMAYMTPKTVDSRKGSNY